MGFFDLFKKKPVQKSKPKTQQKPVEIDTSDIFKKLKRQEQIIKKANDAMDKYAETHDPYPAIAVYEEITKDPDMVNGVTQWMRLAELYYKAEEYDKEWGYLNFLLTTDHVSPSRVYHEMARVLKKEKRHAEAISKFQDEYLSKAEFSRDFNRKSFLKAIKPSVNALKLSDADAEEFADMVQYQVDVGKFDYSEMKSIYESYLKKGGIL